MATVGAKPITIEEFSRMPDPPDGSQLELIRGEIVVMPPPKGKHGFICAEIAVEVLSPSDRRKDVREKIKEYVQNGVKLVWLVDPDTRTVMVYQGSLRGIELDEADTLTGGEVLPNFSCKVAELFA